MHAAQSTHREQGTVSTPQITYYLTICSSLVKITSLVRYFFRTSFLRLPTSFVRSYSFLHLASIYVHVLVRSCTLPSQSKTLFHPPLTPKHPKAAVKKSAEYRKRTKTWYVRYYYYYYYCYYTYINFGCYYVQSL